MNWLIFMIGMVFPLCSFALGLGDVQLPHVDTSTAVIGGLAAAEFFLGKSKYVKANSTIELVLDVIFFIGRFLIGRRGGFDVKFILPLFFLMSIALVGCSSEQVEQVKTVTARGLGEGVADFMLTPSLVCGDKALLVCEREEMARAYFVQKSCDALDAHCAPESISKMEKKKGFLARFACKSAVKIVLPAILPSNQLPDYLRVDAGCVAACPDQLAQDYAPKLCDRL